MLDWTNKTLGKEEAPPGNQDKQETSAKDFMAYLKDGQVLGKLANMLAPGSIETVNEEDVSVFVCRFNAWLCLQDKDKQTENIKNFLNFAKEKYGVGAAEKVKAEDVQVLSPAPFIVSFHHLFSIGGQDESVRWSSGDFGRFGREGRSEWL